VREVDGECGLPDPGLATDPQDGYGPPLVRRLVLNQGAQLRQLLVAADEVPDVRG
jgi:hypothetical protein